MWIEDQMEASLEEKMEAVEEKALEVVEKESEADWAEEMGKGVVAAQSVPFGPSILGHQS